MANADGSVFFLINESRNELINAIGHQDWFTARLKADDFKSYVIQQFFEENVDTRDIYIKFNSFIRLLDKPFNRIGQRNKSRVCMEKLEEIRNYINMSGVFIGQRRMVRPDANINHVMELQSGIRTLIFMAQEVFISKSGYKVEEMKYIINIVDLLKDSIIPNIPVPIDDLKIQTIKSANEFLAQVATISFSTQVISKEVKDALSTFLVNADFIVKANLDAGMWTYLEENPTAISRSNVTMTALIEKIIDAKFSKTKADAEGGGDED